jgi:23S rRNA pseudouridine2605 synthase
VYVNDRQASLGDKAHPGQDVVRLDGQRVMLDVPGVYVLLHKPRGVLSSLESQDGRPTVVDLVQTATRVVPAGRLDADSEGLMLLTNDGDLIHRLTHPSFGHEKEYRVQLDRSPDEDQLRTWRRGVVLRDGYRTRRAKVFKETGRAGWLRVILQEGRKRQIRETAELLGLRVRSLVRVRMGPVRLGDLPPGAWRHLEAGEVASLKESLRGSARRGESE